MQSLLKLGLFKKRQYENVIDSTISISYLLDENIFINLEFSSEFRTFEKNSGLYTVHHIDKTNLYIIFIYDYLQIAYPVSCPDNKYCQNVETPGCIKDDTNQNGIIDSSDNCRIFDEQPVCNVLKNNNSFIINVNKTKNCIQNTQIANQCLLEKSKTFDMCITNLDSVIDNLVCIYYPFELTAGEIFAIVLASWCLFGWCIGACFLSCYQNWGKMYGYPCYCKRDTDKCTKNWCSFINVNKILKEKEKLKKLQAKNNHNNINNNIQNQNTIELNSRSP
eukprot:277620_1